MKMLLVALMAAGLVGCTTVSVVQQADGICVASGRSAAGVAVNYPALHAKVQEAAFLYAQRRNCVVQEVDRFERNRWIPGFPYSEYRFRMVPADGSRAGDGVRRDGTLYLR